VWLALEWQPGGSDRLTDPPAETSNSEGPSEFCIDYREVFSFGLFEDSEQVAM
jgi:hypothetical protein